VRDNFQDALAKGRVLRRRGRMQAHPKPAVQTVPSNPGS